MTQPLEHSLDVLTLVGERASMAKLLHELEQQGFRVDIAHTLGDARTLFFSAGGHDCLVVAPDVGPGLATKVLSSLRTVDPDLPTASFGPALRGREAPTKTAHLASFHPSSRAGAGALLRFLRNLGQRGD